MAAVAMIPAFRGPDGKTLTRSWLETTLSIGQGGALVLVAWLSELNDRTGTSKSGLRRCNRHPPPDRREY
jgi:hypothetical protein